jgi:hypothetical protein
LDDQVPDIDDGDELPPLVVERSKSMGQNRPKGLKMQKPMTLQRATSTEPDADMIGFKKSKLLSE